MVDDFDWFVILLISDLIRGLEETRDRSEQLVFVFLSILNSCSFLVASSLRQSTNSTFHYQCILLFTSL